MPVLYTIAVGIVMCQHGYRMPHAPLHVVAFIKSGEQATAVSCVLY
jgi:hypothetical protein